MKFGIEKLAILEMHQGYKLNSTGIEVPGQNKALFRIVIKDTST